MKQKVGTTVRRGWSSIGYAQFPVPGATVEHALVWLLEVDGFPLVGLNGSSGLQRAHWAKLAMYKKAVASLVRGGPVHTKPVVALYVRAYRSRPMDGVDNLAASSKPVWDGLTRCGAIPGDSDNLLTARCVQRPRKELGCDWIVLLVERQDPATRCIEGTSAPHFTCDTLEAVLERVMPLIRARKAPPGAKARATTYARLAGRTPPNTP